MSKKQERGLGRGLSALMSEINVEPDAAQNSGNNGLGRMVPIERVHPNPDQPRKNFDGAELESLAKSIAERGIIQPILVRVDPKNSDAFQIIAGERRWRAAQIAKLHEVPVIKRELSDLEVLEVAIIENVQRENLNPIEEAIGYQTLIRQFNHTQEQVSVALGKSRSHIANLLRLLNLPDQIQEMVGNGMLSAGHARALIGHEDALALAKEIIAKGLSVRETEKLVQKGDRGKEARKPKQTEKDSDTRAIEADLAAHIGMKVDIAHSGQTGGGKFTVSYKTLDQLEKLCATLSSMR